MATLSFELAISMETAGYAADATDALTSDLGDDLAAAVADGGALGVALAAEAAAIADDDSAALSPGFATAGVAADESTAAVAATTVLNTVALTYSTPVPTASPSTLFAPSPKPATPVRAESPPPPCCVANPCGAIDPLSCLMH